MSIFDLTYYGLAVVMLGILGYSAGAGLMLSHQLASPLARNQALGLSLAALGALLTLVSGVVILELARARLIDSLLYQQVHFSIFYVSFGLILYGVIALARRWRAALWAGFALAIVIAAAFLFNPGTYTFTHRGSQINAVQQLVFFLPLFFVTAAGVFTLPLGTARSDQRRVWFALCCAAILLGLLRESTIIPSLGDPELDLLVAFGPFSVGSFCLFMTVRSLAAKNLSTRVRAPSVITLDD
jgi:hypothetical protein